MKIEILKEGVWNGVRITKDIMNKMVENFSHFKNLVSVPLKLGHNKEQPLTDGMPALGRLEKVWIEDGTMMAEAVDMPDIVVKALEKKLYKNVSIEASLEVKHKGKDYGPVLTGLALLGADLPAVNTIKDLQAYMSTAEGITFSNCTQFTAISGTLSTNEGGMKMLTVEELEAALAAERAKLATLKANEITFKAEQEIALKKLEGENKRLKEAQDAILFTASKKAVTDEMEDMVKGKLLTPGQRDKFLAQIKDDATLQNVKMSIDILTEGKELPSNDIEGRVKTQVDKDLEGKRPDEVLHEKATAFSIVNKVSYSQAVTAVMAADAELSRNYTKQFDSEVA